MISLKNKIYISRLINECRFKFISDEKFALKKFKKRKGYKLDLENPQTFTEKLQFLKLYYRNPLMSICADKYYAREYVKLCGYESILKEIYGVYNDVDEIDLALLPKDFFIHWNHMSGGNYIIRNGKIEKNIIELLAEYKKINWYHQGREWQYNYIRPKLLCEELLENGDKSPLCDYKFYCFNGEVKYYMVSLGEYEHKHINHKFDVNGNSIDYLFKENSSIEAEKISIPNNINKMINIAKKLSAPFPHVRVDLYNIDGRIVFGEMTFFSDSGFVNIYSEDMDKKIGSWIDIPRYKADLIKLEDQECIK